MPNKENQFLVSDTTDVKPKWDFSNVNLVTGEGAKLSFSSIEEMDAYIEAFNKACDDAGIE